MITYNSDKNELVTIPFEVTDPETMLPMDITGASFTVTARTRITDSVAAFTGTGTLWTPDADNKILGADIKITPTQSGMFYVTVVASGTGTGYDQTETFRLRVRATATVGSPLQLTTDIDIANAALALCGHKRQITDFSDGTPEAAMAGLMYVQARDALLSDADWSFATRRTKMTEPSTSTRTNWSYVFDLPNDFMMDRYIVVDGVRNPTASQKIPYAIEMNDDATGHVLMTDIPEPELVYTARLEDPMLYPPYFTDALVARLASDMVVPLDLEVQSARTLAELAEYRLRKAIAISYRSGDSGPAPDSEFVTVRTG